MITPRSPHSPMVDNAAMLLYGNLWQFTGSETPLTVTETGPVASTLIVSHDVIRTYQQVIFDLQRQVLRYKVLLDLYMRGPEAYEEATFEPSTPLGEGSVRTINSIIQTRFAEASILRAYDDEET